MPSTSVKPTWWLSHEIRSGEIMRFDSRSQIKFYADVKNSRALVEMSGDPSNFAQWEMCLSIWLWASLSERAFDFAVEKSGAFESVLPAYQIESVPEVCVLWGCQPDLWMASPVMRDEALRGASNARVCQTLSNSTPLTNECLTHVWLHSDFHAKFLKRFRVVVSMDFTT